MPTESNIEQIIQEAISRGDFDNLKGKGKRLDLDAYFSTPEELRMAHAMLRSNDFVPEEVRLMNEIAALKERLAAAEGAERTDLASLLSKKNLKLSLLLEARKRGK